MAGLAAQTQLKCNLKALAAFKALINSGLLYEMKANRISINS
jgi:hypothetical protein